MSALRGGPFADVSAVVLTIGEPSLQDALDALARQTVPLQDVVLIEHVSPASRALNEGAGRVRTPFFVQVDADMVLDAHCVETLRGCVDARTGLVVGELRDPLEGALVGVKLFRTECVNRLPMRDCVTWDTDFTAAIRQAGWQIRRVGDVHGDVTERPTLGEHRPVYSVPYTFRRYLRIGAMLRTRGLRSGLLWQFSTLEGSAHALAPLAQVALAHGLFESLDRDDHVPLPHDPRAEALAALIDRCSTGAAVSLPAIDSNEPLGAAFDRFLAHGRRIRASGSGTALRDALKSLQVGGSNLHALVAKIALGQGVMAPSVVARSARDRSIVRDLVMFDLGRKAPAAHRLVARVSEYVRFRRGRGVSW